MVDKIKKNIKMKMNKDVKVKMNCSFPFFLDFSSFFEVVYEFFSPVTVPCNEKVVPLTMKDIFINRLKKHFLSVTIPCNENISDHEYKRYPSLGCGCELCESKKKWLPRILFESSGDYSIIMKYDIERHSFVYYSDRSFIPYDILNAVAMKFVITFRCRDYFMDNTMEEYENKSPFLINVIKSKKTIKKECTIDTTSIDSPFAKLKNHGSRVGYNPGDSYASSINNNRTRSITKPNQIDDTNDDKILNTFIYLGKFYNTKFLQPTIKKEHDLSRFKMKYSKDWENIRSLNIE